jgi:hypothetical protein
MSDIICFLGVISHCDAAFAYGKFVREDGHVIDDMKIPLSAFNIRPPVATVIIAKAHMDGVGPISKLDLKFRTTTLEETKFLDRIEMAEAFNWIREVQM